MRKLTEKEKDDMIQRYGHLMHFDKIFQCLICDNPLEYISGAELLAIIGLCHKCKISWKFNIDILEI